MIRVKTRGGPGAGTPDRGGGDSALADGGGCLGSLVGKDWGRKYPAREGLPKIYFVHLVKEFFFF